MITGIVTSRLEATVRVPILDVAGQSQAIDAIIDTGFAGFMNLPSATVTRLGLAWVHRDKTQLIDGRVIAVDFYSATVIWDGRPRAIIVQALGGFTLIGMALLASHDLAIRATDGGAVSIEAIP